MGTKMHIRIDEAEKAAAEAVALALGMTLSEMVRTMLVREVERYWAILKASTAS